MISIFFKLFFYILLLRRPHRRHREGKGVCPDVATPCVKDTREDNHTNFYLTDGPGGDSFIARF